MWRGTPRKNNTWEDSGKNGSFKVTLFQMRESFSKLIDNFVVVVVVFLLYVFGQ